MRHWWIYVVLSIIISQYLVEDQNMYTRPSRFKLRITPKESWSWNRKNYTTSIMLRICLFVNFCLLVNPSKIFSESIRTWILNEQWEIYDGRKKGCYCQNKVFDLLNLYPFLIFLKSTKFFGSHMLEKICQWALQRGLNYIFWMKNDDVKFQSLSNFVKK